MAVNDPTTNYGWDLPADGGSTDAWGGILNVDVGDVAGAVESIDEVLGLVEAEIDAAEALVEALDDRVSALTNEPVYVRVYRTATGQTIPDDTLTTLQWDTEDFDNRNLFDTGASATRLTVPTLYSGLYLVRGVVKVPLQSTGDDGREWELVLLKNGSRFASAHFPWRHDGHNADSGHQTLVVERLARMGPADYVEIQVRQTNPDSGSSTAVVSGVSASYFEAIRLPSDVFVTTILSTGALWWYEARLDVDESGAVDESEVATLDDWTAANRDAPNTSGNTVEIETDTTGLNDRPAYRAETLDQGIYQQTSPADPTAMSVLVLIKPSTAATVQRWLFNTGQGANSWFHIRNDGAGADAAEILFTVRAGGAFDSMQSVGVGVYDGNWHAVLCTYDGTTMRIYVDDMATEAASQAHGTGGNINTGKDRVDIMHTNGASAFEGQWTLHAGWDHHLDATERAVLADFLQSVYGITGA